MRTEVTIPLKGREPRGRTELLVRLKSADRDKINMAAGALGVKQSEFTRMVLIRASDKVLEGIVR